MPLMVRPSPPRFLNFGDRFGLPVVLQNQTDAPMTVDLAVRTVNLALTDGAGRRVKVPANDRVEVLLPAAAELPGTARFQVAASAGRWADAAEQALPVWTPATTEAFATYGELDKGAVRQAVAMPGDVVKEFGGLEIQTSSTQLQALTDAVLYLVSYPYECAEQTSSRILAIAGLRDVLSAFQAAGLPSKAELEKAVARDIDKLKSLQNGDGGFAWWVRGYESWPYISIHGGHALIRAKDKGFDVPAAMLERNLGYLKNIERHIPHWYPVEVRRALVAYSLYVRKRMGDVDVTKAKGLMREAGLKGLSMDAIGWILYTLSGDQGSGGERAEIHRWLDNRVSETAGAANWTGGYADGNYLILHSDRRDDGILLEALITDKPKSDLIPKVVRGLLAHQKQGRWQNTQENAFVLLAMDRYFHQYEKVTPNFVSRIWFGDAFAGQHAFKGRTTDKHAIEIPMAHVAKVGKGDVVIDKQGAGRLYYRIGMTYAPASLRLDPADHGFAVQRVYEAVDKPGDVVRQADGSWKIKAGAMVRVRLAMVAENRRYHVALVDPLPAGLEAMNPALAVTGTIPQDPKAQQGGGRYWWWYRTWYEHQNMRDERVEAFTSLLWAGVHEYTYVARATTPGTFVVPPTKAEEMYSPETFGRSASDKVVIE
jgi:alpha-2-macroglobulin